MRRTSDRLVGYRVVVFFAHPDDEAYSVAGTVATCAGEGARVTIVSATRGEAGTVRGTPVSPPPDSVAGIRTAELEAACHTIGARSPVFLDLPDGRLAELEPTAASKGLIEVLEAEAPHVIISHGSDGAYGHTDHLAATAMLDAALRRFRSAGDVRVLHAAFPRGLMVPVWQALRTIPGLIHPEIVPESLGITADQADLTMDITSCRELKLAAIGCHRSQLLGGDPMSFLRPGFVASLLEEEWFTVASGAPLPRTADHPLAGP